MEKAVGWNKESSPRLKLTTRDEVPAGVLPLMKILEDTKKKLDSLSVVV